MMYLRVCKSQRYQNLYAAQIFIHFHNVLSKPSDAYFCLYDFTRCSTHFSILQKKNEGECNFS